MSPLTLVTSLTVFVMPLCRGDAAEVPVRFVGWSAEDAAWLADELAGWVDARDRMLCAAGPADEALVLTTLELEGAIDFTFKGRTRHRAVSRGADGALFRYQVAAAAEELVRSTWEAPPPPRFSVFARAEVEPLLMGAWFVGGGGGASFSPGAGVSLELTATAATLQTSPLAGGGAITGWVAAGTASVSWLPLHVGVVQAGPRASLQAGALSLRVEAPASPSVSATTPWLQVGGGLTTALAFKHAVIAITAEVVWAPLGAAVQVEGVAEQRVRGTAGRFGLQAGWSW